MSDHFVLLKEAIETASGKYLSIEMTEIAYKDDPTVFYEKFSAALSYLAGEPVPEPRDAFVEISTVMADRPFYSPRDFFQRSDLAKEDYQNLARLLGSELDRAVPCESAA